MKRRIEKLIDLGLTGMDTVLCWFLRRIQPLQHHDRLLHEFVETNRKDSLRTCEDNLTTNAIVARMKKMVKVVAEDPKAKEKGKAAAKDKTNEDFTISLDMFTGG